MEFDIEKYKDFVNRIVMIKDAEVVAKRLEQLRDVAVANGLNSNLVTYLDDVRKSVPELMEISHKNKYKGLSKMEIDIAVRRAKERIRREEEERSRRGRC